MKRNVIRKTIFRYLRCFALFLLVFSLGMICVYLIPNSALDPRFSKSQAQIEKEKPYAVYLFDTDAAIMDNYMDGLMVNSCYVSDTYTSKIKAAFDNNGYPRYWNGYLLTLRPFLTQFTYQQTRYISMFILLLAFCFSFSGIHKQLNAPAAFSFAISIIACFLVFLGESLQYFSVFMILFSVMLIILYVPSFQSPINSALLLFAAGMTTNFFDMLTAPLLTLGMPLTLLLCIWIRNENMPTLFERIKQIIIHSITWGAGYALCWISKWALGTLILGINVFEDAMKTAKFRVEGSEAIPLNRAQMFRLNIDTYYFAKGHKPAAILFLILIILIAVLVRKHKKDWMATIISFLLIAVLPYIWFFVFANHSQLHYFYTYRIQAVTLFSLLCALCSSIDWGSFSYFNKNNEIFSNNGKISV